MFALRMIMRVCGWGGCAAACAACPAAGAEPTTLCPARLGAAAMNEAVGAALSFLHANTISSEARTIRFIASFYANGGHAMAERVLPTPHQSPACSGLARTRQ